MAHSPKDDVQTYYIPKNLSDEGNYHQKYYYPRLVYENACKKMDQSKSDGGVDCDSPSTESPTQKDRDRSWSLQSDDSGTVYSEDYTDMTEVGDNSDLDLSAPPGCGGDEDGRTTSLSSLQQHGGGHEEDEALEEDMELIGAFSKLLQNKDIDKVRHVKQKAPEIQLTMNEKLLHDPLPSPTEEMESWSGRNDGGREQNGAFFEDREFDFLKTEKPRRSTSLKTYKTPPGTPSRKKAVRFADALGLDLESVRHILNLDVPPKIPDSAIKDLQVGLEEEHKSEGSRYLTACFSQPGGLPDFLLRVQHKKVMLENCLVDDRSMTITGTVRVANISYHKKVVIRFTLNKWRTHQDVQASYVHNSNDGLTDRFAFTVNVPLYFTLGNRLEFAIMFVSEGQSYWDNNYGANYGVECYARALPTHENDQTWVHFM